MRFSTTRLLAVLSILCTSTATSQKNANIRVPLERRSLVVRADDGMNYVDVDALRAQVAAVAKKYRGTLAVYRSNTGSEHPLAQALGTNRATILPRADALFKRGDVSLTEVNSNMWMGTISVGTPPQNFTVDIDTGSADLILPSTSCDDTCDGHTRYNPAGSSTSLDLEKTFQMQYSGGSDVNGTQYADDVHMGGYEAANQTFGAATTYSSGLQRSSFVPDGLFGLGFSYISALNAQPAFQTMVSNGVVPEAVFGIALSSEPGKSALTLGGTDTSMYQTSTVEYVNVSLPAYWQLRLAGLGRPGLNDSPDVVVVNKTSYAESIIDTGTTVIITTDELAQAFYANVAGASDMGGGIWSVPCDVVGQLAPTVTYGTRNFTVSSATFNLGPVSNGSSDCVAGLAGGGSPYWILGDVFLQNVYSIFDVGNTRVGFADLA